VVILVREGVVCFGILGVGGWGFCFVERDGQVERGGGLYDSSLLDYNFFCLLTTSSATATSRSPANIIAADLLAQLTNFRNPARGDG